MSSLQQLKRLLAKKNSLRSLKGVYRFKLPSPKEEMEALCLIQEKVINLGLRLEYNFSNPKEGRDYIKVNIESSLSKRKKKK